MTDSSKRISLGSKTYFQLGFESLVPGNDKVYALERGDNEASAKLVAVEGLSSTATEVADLAAEADLAAVITKVNAVLAALRTRGVIATPAEE